MIRSTKSGAVLRVETAVKLLHTGEGPRVVAIVRDITFRKQAESALKRRSASARLFKSIAVAANEAAELEEALQTAIDEVCAYTGWPVGHVYLPGDRPDVLIPTRIWHVDDPEKYATFMRVTESTSFARGEGLPGRVLKSGLPAWIPDVTEDSNFPRAKAAESINVKGGFGFPILVGTDVAGVLEFYSDDPQAPDAELLDLLGQIGTQLGRVAERMRADALTKQFISNAAHELRTPITTIVGFASVLANQKEGVPESQLEQIFAALNRQSERLRALVNDLLDYTRMQQSLTPPELNAVPVSSLLAGVVTNTPAPEGKSVQTVAPDGLVVLTDRLRCDQILVNLITNAYRYGGNSITIDARGEDGFVDISVSDDGPGVAVSLIDHLFEPFARGAEAAYVGGSGLGLAIARLLARSQGGDLRYEPGELGGARFVLRLRAQS
ncbi:MAG: ATP-binding protein [Actinomycetota bacterium]